MSPFGDCVVITFLSFRASEARHGIQYFQHVLDAGFHRHDDVDGFFTIATQSLGGGRGRMKSLSLEIPANHKPRAIFSLFSGYRPSPV